MGRNCRNKGSRCRDPTRAGCHGGGGGRGRGLWPVAGGGVPVHNQHEDQALRLGRGNLSRVCGGSPRSHSAQPGPLDVMVTGVKINSLDQLAYIFSFSFQHNMKNFTARC